MQAVTLYRRRQCGLCDDALVMLRGLSREHPLTIVEQDIDDDPELRARYNESIPVVAFGAAELARAPIDPDDLRAAVESALQGEVPP